MKTQLIKPLLTALLLTLATPALADAVTSFHDGKWAMVVKEGRAEATPASLVLSGRAQLVQAVSPVATHQHEPYLHQHQCVRAK